MAQDEKIGHGGRFNIMTGDALRVLDALISGASDPQARQYLRGVQDGIRQASDIFFKTKDETNKFRPEGQ